MIRETSRHVILTVVIPLFLELHPLQGQPLHHAAKTIAAQPSGPFRDCAECPEMTTIPPCSKASARSTRANVRIDPAKAPTRNVTRSQVI
jgi:hypothetical protein